MISTTKAQAAAHAHGLATYSDETGDDIVIRFRAEIAARQAAIDDATRTDVESDPTPPHGTQRPDPDSMWDCERCLNLEPCETHDDDGATNERTAVG
jgi:hypothetical protein